ncbi:MAG: hypothetical protein IT424_05840 [Pirellulales bacterium]|nr:hypothetical protein [Pirellulales bacterium]
MKLLSAICLILLAAVLPTAEAADERAATSPEVYDFTKSELPAGWEVESSDGASVKPVNGLLAFDCSADRHAVVRHPLGADDVSITARIHDAAMLYVVWADGDFVGVGKVSPTPFARFQTVTAVQNSPVEVDHTGCHGPAAHLVRIQLGDDCIRFQYADGDGSPDWRSLRAIERASAYHGAPAYIAVGKNLGVDRQAASLVNTDSVGRGARGLLARVEVAATPAADLMVSPDERRWLSEPRLDPVQELLNDSDRDPTFEEVARYYPGLKFQREVVGVPGQRTDIGVDWLGRIDASPWEGPVAWFEIGDSSLHFADEPAEVSSRRLCDGYVPIVTLRSQRANVNYEMTVFGWADRFSPTAQLYAYVRLSAWAGGETAALPQRIRLNGKENKPVEFTPQTTPSGLLTLCLRMKHPDPQTAEAISDQQFESARRQAESAWRDQLAECAPFELPDPRVNEAYRAWLAYSMLNADRIDGRLHVHDGAGFYDLQFGYSVALHAMALDQYRLPHYVADVLATQVHYQKPDGHYIQECGLPDHGGFVLSLANHYLITRDADWLQQHAEPLKQACQWIIERRAEGPREGMCRGLIKFRPYNDYNDPVFNYQGNIYCCQGLEAAAMAFSEAGDAEAAERYGAEAAQYRRDILDSMDAAAFTRDGVRMIPIEPDTRRLLKLTKYRGGEYYGLVASTLFENGFFATDDPRAALFRNMLEQQGGLTAGVCEFQEGIDHAYTCGYLMDRLRAGEVRKTLLGFWSGMAYGMTRQTYSPVEVTLYKTGANHYTLPHTYSCTQQLRLLRQMLLREEGGGLILAQGVPSDWLAPGKRIAVTAAPTLLGPVSYSIETDSSSTVRIRLQPPKRKTAEQVQVRLRHPLGRKIVACEGSAEGNIAFDAHTILVTRPTHDMEFTVRFAAE